MRAAELRHEPVTLNGERSDQSVCVPVRRASPSDRRGSVIEGEL